MESLYLFVGSAIFFLMIASVLYGIGWPVMRVALWIPSPRRPHRAKRVLWAALLVPPTVAGALTLGGVMVHNQHLSDLIHYFPWKFPEGLPPWVPTGAALLLQGLTGLLLGAIAFRLARLCRTQVALNRDLKYCLQPPSEKLAAVLATVQRNFPHSRLAFYEADLPMTYSSVLGFFRPRCILSRALVTSATEAELNAAVAHELSHVEAGDLRRAWAVSLIQHVFFMMPWVLDLAARWREAAEISCDAATVATTGDPLSLATAILRVQGIVIGPPRASASALALADTTASSATRRVEYLLAYVGKRPAKDVRGADGLHWLAGSLITLVSLDLVLASKLFYAAHCSLETLVRLVR